MSFHLTVYYEKNLNDLLFIKNKIKNKLSSALIPNDQDQSDPKELFCLSWIICFFKVSKKILNQKGYENLDVKLDLDVPVHQNQDGYYFELILKVGIQNLSLEESKIILELAHKRCPISKMIAQYKHLKIIPVNYDDILII